MEHGRNISRLLFLLYVFVYTFALCLYLANSVMTSYDRNALHFGFHFIFIEILSTSVMRILLFTIEPFAASKMECKMQTKRNHSNRYQNRWEHRK